MYGLSINFCCCSIVKTPPIFDRYIVPNIDGIIYFFSALACTSGGFYCVPLNTSHHFTYWHYIICIFYLQHAFSIFGLQVFTIISPPTGLYGNSLSNFLTARSMFFLISSSSDISCIVSLLKY